MFGFPSEAEIRYLRECYPAGARIRLENMDDPYAPVPAGTEGTVVGVDDGGNIMMNWDNGRSLPLIAGVDRFHKI